MIEEREQDAAVKARHRAMWALGDYSAVAAQVIPQLGATLVRAAGVGPGMRVLDVAAGTGNAALPAARTGAQWWPGTSPRSCWRSGGRQPSGRA
ncbi:MULTISPECIES: hypothetical protein [unclassified Micromonospora]|uniref:hypothetical protein n=1 Tax=unclassified Micromonospora TaxID=2617518 RepID=UPI000A4C23E7